VFIIASSPTAREASGNQLKASGLMLIAVFSFIGMALSVRELSHSMSVFQILFLRVAVALPILLSAMLIFKGPQSFALLRTSNVKLHIVRNIFQMGGQATWIFAIAMLPFATVFAIEYGQPIWAALFGSLILREHPNRWQKVGLAMGFVGVLVIVRPGTEGFSWAALLLLFGSMLYGANYLVTRVLTRTDHALSNPFYTSVMQMPVGLALTLLFAEWVPLSWQTLPYVLVLACGSAAAQHCVAAALSLAPLARVIPIDYLRLPIIATIGAVFYAEAIDPIAMAGAAIVIAGVVLTQRKGPA